MIANCRCSKLPDFSAEGLSGSPSPHHARGQALPSLQGKLQSSHTTISNFSLLSLAYQQGDEYYHQHVRFSPLPLPQTCVAQQRDHPQRRRLCCRRIGMHTSTISIARILTLYPSCSSPSHSSSRSTQRPSRNPTSTAPSSTSPSSTGSLASSHSSDC